MNREQRSKLDDWITREDPRLSEVCEHTEDDTECDECLAFEVEDDPRLLRACRAMWFDFDRAGPQDQQNRMVCMAQALRAADEQEE